MQDKVHNRQSLFSYLFQGKMRLDYVASIWMRNRQYKSETKREVLWPLWVSQHWIVFLIVKTDLDISLTEMK